MIGDRGPKRKAKIKVLYVYPSLPVGGAEELRFLVLKNLQHKGSYDLKVCCIEDAGEIGEKIKSLGIEVFCLRQSAKPNNIFATLSLSAYLLKNKFDVVQTSLFNANFHGRIASVLTGVPVIISEEHSEHYQYSSWKFLPYIWSDKILSFFTDKIICCSRNLMHSISRMENIPLNKFFPLLNTFNIEKLKVTKNALELKRELGLDDNNIILTNIAFSSYRKGQDLLIRAFKTVNDAFPLSKLVIIGNEVPEFKEKLSSLIKCLGLAGEVLFLGIKNNIADYLNITDIFVLSSRFEGIPLAMLEAMYMQVPVVAVRVGGITEVIVHGQNGILAEPNNIGSVSAAIKELLNNKEKRVKISKEGKKTVLDLFNNERYINELESLYSKLLGGRFRNG